jgi:adenine nucleotide transporter 17
MSFIDTLNHIVNEDGLAGLWKGLRASLILCVNPAITYGMFERLKRLLLDRKLAARPKATLTSLEAFLVGALSKTLATIVTCRWMLF